MDNEIFEILDAMAVKCHAMVKSGRTVAELETEIRETIGTAKERIQRALSSLTGEQNG